MKKKKIRPTNDEKYYHYYTNRNNRKTKEYKIYKENKNFRNYELEKESDFEDKKIDINHLENLFTKDIYYYSMKYLPIKYKNILYFCIYENRDINYISKILNISKFNVVITRNKAIKLFKKNIKLYKKNFGIRKVDIENE